MRGSSIECADESESATRFGPAESARFCSIEEMQAACEKKGWSIDFRQLQAGTLTASMSGGTCGGISLLDQSVSRRVDVLGASPEEHLTVMAPIGQGTFCVNGQRFCGKSVVVLGPDEELHSVNNEILRVMAMNVPISLFQETHPEFFDTWESGSRVTTKVIKAGATNVASLRRLINTTIHRPATSRWQVERALDLATCFGDVMVGRGDHESGPKRPLESWRTVSRAREYIDANLSEAISIQTVSEHSAASISKLERAFRRELDMSPGQYVMARRLAAARGELMGRSPEETNVARIAMNYGFHHLGRFSGTYRTNFGESPSETLRAS